MGKKYASYEELTQAADVAQARDFIESKEERFETHLAEGEAISPRWAKVTPFIARAVVKEPDIYIFDDSFSALDYKTDAILRSRLKEVSKCYCIDCSTTRRNHYGCRSDYCSG